MQDRDYPIVQTVKHLYEDYSGPPTDIHGTPAGTDARLSVFDGGIPPLWFDPKGGFAPGFDEYVNLDTVLDATKGFAETIIDWCGYEAP